MRNGHPPKGVISAALMTHQAGCFPATRPAPLAASQTSCGLYLGRVYLLVRVEGRIGSPLRAAVRGGNQCSPPDLLPPTYQVARRHWPALASASRSIHTCSVSDPGPGGECQRDAVTLFGLQGAPGGTPLGATAPYCGAAGAAAPAGPPARRAGFPWPVRLFDDEPGLVWGCL